MKSLWTVPRTSFEGRYYRVDSAPCEPKPLQRPHPPIMVAGEGVGALQIAAKHATGSNMCGSPERLAKRVLLLRGFCDRAGRDFDEIELSVHSDLAIASTREDAEELTSRALAQSGQAIESQRDTWIRRYPERGG